MPDVLEPSSETDPPPEGRDAGVRYPEENPDCASLRPGNAIGIVESGRIFYGISGFLRRRVGNRKKALSPALAPKAKHQALTIFLCVCADARGCAAGKALVPRSGHAREIIRAMMIDMTGNLKELVAQVETWPEEDQRELVEYAREIEARRTGVYAMTDEERAAVNEGLAQIRRGEFASDEDMDAFWKRHGVA